MSRKEAHKKIGLDKSTYLNYLRTAKKRLFDYLKSCNEINASQIQKLHILVSVFCEKYNIQKPNRSQINEWLVLQYLNPENEIIFKAESLRNYTSSDWNRVKKIVFKIHGPRCLCCSTDIDVCIDHIKPYILFPELSTDINNLQPLCRSCNSSKGIKIIDYRQKKKEIAQDFH
jgi:hypothetical protein